MCDLYVRDPCATCVKTHVLAHHDAECFDMCDMTSRCVWYDPSKSRICDACGIRDPCVEFVTHVHHVFNLWLMCWVRNSYTTCVEFVTRVQHVWNPWLIRYPDRSWHVTHQINICVYIVEFVTRVQHVRNPWLIRYQIMCGTRDSCVGFVNTTCMEFVTRVQHMRNPWLIRYQIMAVGFFMLNFIYIKFLIIWRVASARYVTGLGFRLEGLGSRIQFMYMKFLFIWRVASARYVTGIEFRLQGLGFMV